MEDFFNTRHNNIDNTNTSTSTNTIEKIFSKNTLSANIDLNISQNLENLEDPLLIQHISDSRKLLEKYKKKYQEDIFKSKEELNSSLFESTKFSTANIVVLNEINISLSNIIENLFLQNSNINKLAVGDLPYGFPAIEENNNKITKQSFKKNMEYLNKKITMPITDLQVYISQLLELEKKMGIVERKYDFIIGKLFDFNQTLMEKNNELLEKLFEYEKDNDSNKYESENESDLEYDNANDNDESSESVLRPTLQRTTTSI